MHQYRSMQTAQSVQLLQVTNVFNPPTLPNPRLLTLLSKERRRGRRHVSERPADKWWPRDCEVNGALRAGSATLKILGQTLNTRPCSRPGPAPTARDTDGTNHHFWTLNSWVYCTIKSAVANRSLCSVFVAINCFSFPFDLVTYHSFPLFCSETVLCSTHFSLSSFCV